MVVASGLHFQMQSILPYDPVSLVETCNKDMLYGENGAMTIFYMDTRK